MSELFDPLKKLLPEADIHPLIEAFLSQGDNHQVIFMESIEEVIVPEHSHAPQWEFVLDGELDLTRPSGTHTYRKGDWFFLAEGEKHAGHLKKGYKSVAVFFQSDRYGIK